MLASSVMALRRGPSLVALVLLAAGCSPVSRTSPHVILVLVDALRQDHVGAYGYSRPTTPFLDRLAARGVLFERAYAQGSETFVSTSSLLSGLYDPLLGGPPVTLPVDELEGEELERHARVPFLHVGNRMLAEILGEAGYETLGVFTNPHHHSRSGFWQGFSAARYLPADPGTGYARASSVHRAFFELLDQRDPDRPFFAYLHVMDVHNPYRPPRVFRRLFRTVEGKDRYRNGMPPPDAAPSSEDLRYMIDLYDAELRFVDGVLRDLMETLAAREVGSTILVVASDHGDEWMEHGGLGHGTTLHGELLRVPLLLHGSDLPAARVSTLVRNLDLFPTLLELAGVQVPPAVDGESLLPLLVGGKVAAPRTSLARLGTARSLTTRRWHFVAEDDRARLYDLDTDPGETADRSAQQPQLVEGFARCLAAVAARTAQKRRRLAPMPAPTVDSEIREQLRKLGYLP